MSETKYNLGEAATSLVAVAQQSRGELLELFAKYLSEATANGHTINAAIDQVTATPNFESLASVSMLKVYSVVIKHAEALGLSMPLGYSAVYFAYDKVKRVAGYDIQATFAPIAKLGTPHAKIKALLKFTNNSAVVNTERAAKSKAKADTKAKAKPKTEAKAPSLKEASPVALVEALFFALKRDKANMSSKDVETLMSRLGEIELITEDLI